jgi:hypothetical protein
MVSCSVGWEVKLKAILQLRRRKGRGSWLLRPELLDGWFLCLVDHA